MSAHKALGKLPLLAVIGAMLTLTVWGEQGLWHLAGLKKKERQIREGNQSLLAENRALLQRIDQLKEAHFLERAIREELGYVYPDEVVFQLAPRAADRFPAFLLDKNRTAP